MSNVIHKRNGNDLSFVSIGFLGLTLEESTDVRCLRRKLEECEDLVNNLKESKQKRYAPRRQKEQLKHQLASKSKAKEHVSEQNLSLKAR